MSFRFQFTETFKRDYQQHDKKAAARIDVLVESVLNDPFRGIGKPEPLRFGLSGFWSRRINREDRLIYKVEDDLVMLYSCRGHYEHHQ